MYIKMNNLKMEYTQLRSFISNPFSRNVETKTNEIRNLFDFDKNILEIEIITLQNDSVLKFTSEI